MTVMPGSSGPRESDYTCNEDDHQIKDHNHKTPNRGTWCGLGTGVSFGVQLWRSRPTKLLTIMGAEQEQFQQTPTALSTEDIPNALN